MYPIEKYKFYQSGNKVIAVSTYAGKTVRGVAVCSGEDEFSLEKGKQLAATRCEVKVAQKRLKRAEKKSREAYEAYKKAEKFSIAMDDYYDDAKYALDESIDHLHELLNEL